MSTAAPSTCYDSQQGYGRVSRVLHWSMVALFAWQFASSALHAWDREAAVSKWFWSSHVSLGVTLLVLAALRVLWALLNLRRRPPAGAGAAGRLARLGHAGLYTLMMAVPVLALARSYGRGKGLAVFGMPLFEATGREQPALVAMGNALHGWLGWALLAMACGHVFMVWLHHYVWRDGTAARMLCRR